MTPGDFSKRNRVWDIGPRQGAPITERPIEPDEAAVAAQNEAGERFGHERVSGDKKDWFHRVWIRFDSRNEAQEARDGAEEIWDRHGGHGLQIIGWEKPGVG